MSAVLSKAPLRGTGLVMRALGTAYGIGHEAA